MKKYSAFFLVCLFFIPNILVAQQDMQRGVKWVQVTIGGTTTTLYKQSHALLIGVSAYDNGFPPLPGVADDISAVKTALEDNGFNVVEVMDPDHNSLLDAFKNFIARYGQAPDNRLLFYFAGHGYTQKMPYGDELGYICPADAPDPEKDPVTFSSRALPMGEIEVFAKNIKSKHALFLFDACFSGSVFAMSRAIPEAINYKTKEPVRQFITSGSASETVPDKSIFRSQFIRALNGEADANKDGFITGTELGEFLQTTVINYSYGAQHPQYGKIRNPNLDKGDFVFLLNNSAQQASGTTGQSPSAELTIEAKSLVRHGKLEITTEISGDLYIDEVYKKKVDANSLLTINNLAEGDHNVKVKGDETVEKAVSISPDQTATITIPKNMAASSGLPEMVFVKGGTFQMGSNDGNSNEKPVHAVTVRSFYIGKYEITHRQWKNIMGSNPAYFNGCEDCPVAHISWDEAQEFIKKLNDKTGKNYRLPTEAEWEYAAKGGSKSKGYIYSGSNSAEEVGWYSTNSQGNTNESGLLGQRSTNTHPVGQKQSNELGLFDMSGNVFEFCSDWYDKKYYESSPADNPQGPSSGTYHTRRGSSIARYAKLARTTYRESSFTATVKGRDIDLGFRLCMSAP
ncbi:MAG: SUMF1/EgtB/PvdO family nonheme iron enzyme [Bacteroidetes bacterium]|nr:SUMF1/EgtB/PvdO family nonheme iron enzyme [Bacteroidota bacterium]